MDIATISILITIIVCITGLGEWVRTIKNDAGVTAANVHKVETKVNRLEERLEELKEEEASTKAIVQKVLEEKMVNEKVLALIQEKLEL